MKTDFFQKLLIEFFKINHALQVVETGAVVERNETVGAEGPHPAHYGNLLAQQALVFSEYGFYFCSLAHGDAKFACKDENVFPCKRVKVKTCSRVLVFLKEAAKIKDLGRKIKLGGNFDGSHSFSSCHFCHLRCARSIKLLNFFGAWMVKCMSAAGQADLTPLAA